MNHKLFCIASCLFAVAIVSPSSDFAHAARPIVPGTGTEIEYVGDDFEDPSWDFIHQFPKSSREQDSQLRSPTGRSTNGRWIEGPERGQPDQMKVVPTPAGGLAGSKYSLMLRTLNSGIPGRHLYDVQQDDLIANCISRLGTTIAVAETPSVVTRVYLPPADQWEDRSGPHFGFRISASTMAPDRESTGFFGSRGGMKAEPYWPGMWIHFRSKTNKKVEEDSAFITVRGDRRGRDIKMKTIPLEQFGWWTMGMSVTGDGMVHYYAKPGVEDLTAADHITSQFPYSYSAQRFRTFFFDSCNKDDGKSWSTPFVIDDPQLFVVNASRIIASVNRKIERAAKSKTKKNAKVANKRKPRNK